MSLMTEEPYGAMKGTLARPTSAATDDADTDDERGVTILYGAVPLCFSVQSSGSQGQTDTD